MQEAIKNTEATRNWDEHKIPTAELCKRYHTDAKLGLTSAMALKIFNEGGANELSKKEAVPWYCLFIQELTGFFSLLLWFGSFLCFFGYGIQADKEDRSNLYLGTVLAAVTLVTGIFSYLQASKSAEMMAQFENFIPPIANVIRDGKATQIEARMMVPGDLVLIAVGENIPADTIVFESKEMKVNNASLTGEPLDILMDPDAPKENFIMEAKNCAFFGTSCSAGKGKGIAIKTGDRTVIGQIANLASSAEAKETPLSIEIERFIHIISAIAITLGVVFFCFGLATYDLIQNMVFAIGIIVANVPEGLLATVTVSLALTAQRMAGKMVLVKNLESVETLGSTSCICSDKTGTLTQNRMTASHMYVNRQTLDVGVNWQSHLKNQARPKPDENIVPGYDSNDSAFKDLVKAIVLSTSTYFAYEPTTEDAKKLYARVRGMAVADVDDKTMSPADEDEMKARLRIAEGGLNYVNRFCKGDASETGLVQFAQPLLDLDATRADFPTHSYTPAGSTNEVDCAIPFSSDQKFNLFIRNMAKDGKHLRVYLKGAPERVITRCSKILVDGKEEAFTQQFRDEVATANDDFGKLGERVLAFAYADLDISKFPEGYAFDMRNWKSWGAAFERSHSEYESEPGTFPMHDLTLVGAVSLNDPPRPKVDLSVEKCRQAGIKVIMVTGDQPPTAAAIANKVNIIKHPQKEYNNMKARGVDDETAMRESTGIVIHGDTLAKMHAEDEEKYEDGHPEKGAFIQRWISKPEVVFARTTPSQKLLIVNACQLAGHVVAVTGDGVNDSPAIKKADIGIAMGSGSDVAKNAADMLLLDDNFSSIVNGVEEGRLIFDNLKKSIAYTLSSNIPEILPFIMFILFAVPLPLSTVLILCIDLGTDMVPAISFAYENTEADIMDRVPRNSKLDHLVNSKLISFAYLQIGVIQASAGMYTYFYVLNDFGVRPGGLFRLAGKLGAFPDDQVCLAETPAGCSCDEGAAVPCDVVDTVYTSDADGGPTADPSGAGFWPNGQFKGYNGNNNWDLPYYTGDGERNPDLVILSWDKTKHARTDVRMFYGYRDAKQADSWDAATDSPVLGDNVGPIRGADAFTSCRWDPRDETIPSILRRSVVSDYPICYSTEALKFAQAGYLVSIVCVQWADLMICKTRNLSLAQQGMINVMGNFGLFFETALVAILLYIPALNIGLGTRQIPPAHFAVPSFSFFTAIFFYDELRKIWLRDGMVREHGRLKLKGWITRNTYY